MAKLDRENMYGSVYDKRHFTDEEMQGYQDVVEAALAGKTGWDDAHRYADRTRAKYGYSGGEDGSGYIALDGSGEDFSYADAPTYTRRRAGQIRALTDAALDREPFTYDPETDPLYQQYKDSYTRQGRRAMEDTLGKVSARTGGLASSYAAQASQQTYDQYMAALADKIPELRSLAYQMYRDEDERRMRDIDLLRQLDGDERADYLTDLGQYNADRSFDYGVWSDRRDDDYRRERDALADERWERQWDYDAGRDRVGDERWERQWAYDAARDADSDAWRQKQWDYALEQDARAEARQKAATLAAAGDFSGYAELGYTREQIAGLRQAWQSAQQAAVRRGGGSGGSSGSGGGAGTDFTGMLDTMRAFGDDDKAYLYLLGQKLSDRKTEEIWARYAAGREESGSSASASAPAGAWAGAVSPVQAAASDGYRATERALRERAEIGADPADVSRILRNALESGQITMEQYRTLYARYS